MTNEEIVVGIRAGEDVNENMLQLWQQNSGFIGKMAVRFSGYAELDDLKQEGYIGLCEAVRHYDLDKGVPFINYAAFWIKETMQRYTENSSGVVRIPSGLQQDIRKYKRMRSEYKKYYGREPSDREIQTLLHIGEEMLDRIKKTARMGQIRSLSEPLSNEDGETVLADTVADNFDLEGDVVERLDFQSMSNELWKEVDRLPEQQCHVIRERFLNKRTIKETGEELGVSFEQARALQNKAMRTLRIPSRCGKVRSYYEEYIEPADIHHVGLESFKTTWTSEVERAALRGLEN